MRPLRPNSVSRQSKLWMFCSLLFGLGVAVQAGKSVDAGTSKLPRPVMMDSNGSGSDLFVVDASGNLHEFHVKPNALEEYRMIALPGDFTASDMTYLVSGGQESFLIAGIRSGRGAVVLYSVEGKSLKAWSLRNISSGIDFGATTHTAYVATADSNEIYRLELKAPEASFVARVDDAGKLGPLAFDEAGQEIYVADVAVGKIYKYSIASKTWGTLATNLSAPTALSFDPDSRRLYIADPGRRGIFTLDTRSNKAALLQFASGQMQAPYGLALLSQNRVAVADYLANSVLVFSNKGVLLFRSSLAGAR